MPKKPPISDADRELFRKAVKGASPLSQDRITQPKSRPAPKPRFRDADEQEVLKDMLSDPIDPADLETGEELLFARSGLQHNVLRKLRRGQYSVNSELDLHGMIAAEAKVELVAFLNDSRRRGHRCVRIIHGKGNRSLNREPVLKGKVAHWLQQRDEVLAFCSARPIDGGTGAVYVLLKRG